jgi:hypothetical protein
MANFLANTDRLFQQDFYNRLVPQLDYKPRVWPVYRA